MLGCRIQKGCPMEGNDVPEFDHALRAEIRFSNSRLYNLLIENFSKPAEEMRSTNGGHGVLPLLRCASIAIGISYGALSDLLNLRTGPITTFPVQSRNRIRRSAQLIADYFEIEVEILFPMAIYNIGLDKPAVHYFAEADVVRFSDLKRPLRIAGPDVPDARIEQREAIDRALITLSPREEKILRLRFGLDGSEHTREEIGWDLGVTSCRVMQIEAKALRKMRHPCRSTDLREYYCGC